jgi:DNA-binding response OmpR family regulator
MPSGSAADRSPGAAVVPGQPSRSPSSEQAARKSFREKSPSLAVVELLISGGAGLDLCRFFREQGSDVLIVAVSVLECRDLAVEAGADAFLLKPLEPLQLVSTVKDLLGSSAFPRSVPEPAP